jgi:hypothetical protein
VPPLQEALLRRVSAVQQISDSKFIEHGVDFTLKVKKDDDIDFKRIILTRVSELGLGKFDVVANENGTIYLRKTDSIEPPKPQDGMKIYNTGYHKSWAVVIGINNYNDSKWERLQYAVNDARAVEKLLRKQGFDIILLLDSEATKQNIEHVLKNRLFPLFPNLKLRFEPFCNGLSAFS